MTSIIMKKTLLSLVLASCLSNQVSSNDDLWDTYCNYDLSHFRSLQKAFPEKDKLFVGISKNRKVINYSVMKDGEFIPIINQRQLDDMKIPQDYQFFFKVSYNPKLNPYQREASETFFRKGANGIDLQQCLKPKTNYS